MAGIALVKRQAFGNNNEDNGAYGFGYGPPSGDHQSWWWTPAGMATRYAISSVIFASILAYFVGGYYHAQRRLRNGQEPLAYHRWMVRRQASSFTTQPAAWPHAPGYGPSYPMDAYTPPPPAYNSAEAPPPVYQPPQGATKAMADQNSEQMNRVDRSSADAGLAEPATAARQ